MAHPYHGRSFGRSWRGRKGGDAARMASRDEARSPAWSESVIVGTAPLRAAARVGLEGKVFPHTKDPARLVSGVHHGARAG